MIPYAGRCKRPAARGSPSLARSGAGLGNGASRRGESLPVTSSASRGDLRSPRNCCGGSGDRGRPHPEKWQGVTTLVRPPPSVVRFGALENSMTVDLSNYDIRGYHPGRGPVRAPVLVRSGNAVLFASWLLPVSGPKTKACFACLVQASAPVWSSRPG